MDECVTTVLSRGLQDVLHPSRQVGNYERYLIDTNSSLAGSDIAVRSCAYLHNLRRDRAEAVFESRFDAVLRRPAFVADDGEALQDFLATSVGRGDGTETLERILHWRFRPSKSLMNETARMMPGAPVVPTARRAGGGVPNRAVEGAGT